MTKKQKIMYRIVLPIALLFMFNLAMSSFTKDIVFNTESDIYQYSIIYMVMFIASQLIFIKFAYMHWATFFGGILRSLAGFNTIYELKLIFKGINTNLDTFLDISSYIMLGLSVLTIVVFLRKEKYPANVQPDIKEDPIDDKNNVEVVSLPLEEKHQEKTIKEEVNYDDILSSFDTIPENKKEEIKTSIIKTNIKTEEETKPAFQQLKIETPETIETTIKEEPRPTNAEPIEQKEENHNNYGKLTFYRIITAFLVAALIVTFASIYNLKNQIEYNLNNTLTSNSDTSDYKYLYQKANKEKEELKRLVNKCEEITYYDDFYSNKYFLIDPKGTNVDIVLNTNKDATLTFQTYGSGVSASWGDYSTYGSYLKISYSGDNYGYVEVTNDINNKRIIIVVVNSKFIR